MYTSILHTIEQHAEHFPDKTAIWQDGKICSYSALKNKIQQAIIDLENAGVERRKHRIYLAGNNSIDLLVLWCALLALETDVVLVDPKSAAQEIIDLQSALPAHFLLLENEIFEGQFSVHANVLSYLFTNLKKDDVHEHGAMVHFFSTGSTGAPKAFSFSEEKLVRQVMNLATHLQLSASDKVLCPVSFTHSHGVMMSLPFLLLGAAVFYLHPKKAQADGIVKAIEENGITVVTGVPFQYNMMLEKQDQPMEMPTLRYAFCGSAPMSEYLAHQFEKIFSVKLNQAYGISEIGPICVNLFEEGENNFQSVGKVISNIDYKIVGEDDKEVVQGENGELLVRSDFMSDGYSNTEASQLFRNGWMCTQDIVREDTFGNIYIIGRKSTFINTAGYKVYPVEIEKVLLSMKGIKDAIVKGEADEARTQSIKAYVSTFFPLSEDEIKAYCRQHLARYKIPHQVIFVDEMPSNAIGKVIAGKLQ